MKGLDSQLQEKIADLKMLMGYPPDYHLPLDTRDAANQVLGGFNGQLVTFAEIQGSSLPLKLAAKKEQVQSNLVTGSYVALVPRPSLLIQQIQNQVDRTSGFNLAVGINYTLWDGFRRVREIKRQKMRAEQLKLDRDQLSQKIYGQFKRIRSGLDVSGEREAFVREQAKLAELGEERALMDYKAGSIPYDRYVDKRLETVEAQLDSVTGPQERVIDLIDLATLAGGLNKYNARIAY
jgi:outer membrane protein TolC